MNDCVLSYVSAPFNCTVSLEKSSKGGKYNERYAICGLTHSDVDEKLFPPTFHNKYAFINANSRLIICATVETHQLITMLRVKASC